MKLMKDNHTIIVVALACVAGLVGYGVLQQKVDAHTIAISELTPKVNQAITDAAVLRESIQDIRDTVHRIEGAKSR